MRPTFRVSLRSAFRPVASATLALVVALLLGACEDPAPAAGEGGGAAKPANAPAKAPRPDAELVVAGRITQPDIDECSGVVKLGDAWWTHCDSGASPVLWRSPTVDFAGASAFTVPGAVNVDWEDITVLDGDLLVADLGDNLRKRKDVALYRVRFTPGTGDSPGSVALVAKYPVAWPDAPHDCEAVYVKDGKLHAITKDRGDGTGVYRFDKLVPATELGSEGRNTPVLIGALNLGEQEQVTSATYDAAANAVVVLTYTQIAEFGAERMNGAPVVSTWISARQCEAVAIDGADLVFTNEQRDIFRVPKYREWRNERLLQKRGKTTLKAETTDIPLVSAKPTEWARWNVTADVVRVEARIRVKDALKPSDVERGRPGTGIILCFAEKPVRMGGNDTTEIAITTGADGAARIDLATSTDAGRKLTPVPGGKASVVKEDGHIVIDASFPATVPFGRALPESFLFDLYGYDTGLEDGPRHSGLDLYCIFRPYTWGDCTR